MKDKKIILAAIVIAAIGALIAMNMASDNQESTGSTSSNVTTQDGTSPMHEEYPTIPENNRYTVETYGQIKDRFENGTGVIFLGFKECPWCQKMVPILNEAAEAEDVTVHYLDIKQLREKNRAAYAELSGHLSPYLQKNSEGNPVITTPDISIVKNGEIVWRYEMDATSEAERTPDAYWTDERKERALQTLRDQMKQMKEV